jgi:plasmid maintenance system antidote protein VapI
MELNDKIIELKSAGRNHSQIAAMLGVHKQDVDAVINGSTDEVKKTAVVETKKPKIHKISEEDGAI